MTLTPVRQRLLWLLCAEYEVTAKKLKSATVVQGLNIIQTLDELAEEIQQIERAQREG